MFTHDKECDLTIKEINKLENTNKKLQKNTVFPYHYIKSKAKEWKLYLEKRIPDFIAADGWYTKTESGVEFHDYTKMSVTPSKPVLHHFRNHSIKQELQYLEKCWQSCKHKHLPIQEELSSTTPLITQQNCEIKEPTPIIECSTDNDNL